MRHYLVALAFVACGAALPLLFYEVSSQDFDGLLERRDQALNEIDALYQADLLPRVNTNWSHLKHYVALYGDLTLSPSDKKTVAKKAIQKNGWHGILRGDLHQLLAAAQYIQNAMPVYFAYFSFEDKAGHANAQLSFQVLGQTE